MALRPVHFNILALASKLQSDQAVPIDKNQPLKQSSNRGNSDSPKHRPGSSNSQHGTLHVFRLPPASPVQRSNLRAAKSAPREPDQPLKRNSIRGDSGPPKRRPGCSDSQARRVTCPRHFPASLVRRELAVQSVNWPPCSRQKSEGFLSIVNG
ncbi:hypothetical protein NDU88_000452 [Pleurodeles waltl]|uniref:Uncharacterized protein n=1 Tax=Pleurodeles waltl TaxID=8319 RepID=A0AAV7SA36_PLEWA|nr:hypothetical protein NDU88_000452 [Pleurodeles waltl]